MPKPAFFILVFAIIGTIALFATRAATPFASIDLGTGSNTASPASIFSDNTASGGSAVQFNAVNTPPPSGGCPAFPEFPNKTCTGVPAGTVLTDISGDITQPGEYLNKRITGKVTIRANNVTFRNCLIQSNQAIAVGFDNNPSIGNFTLENCTIKSGTVQNPKQGFTMRKVLIDPDPGAYRPDGQVIGYAQYGHSGGDVLIEDSYIAAQWGGGCNGCDPDHTDAIQMWGFGTVSNVVIRHNYIDSANVNPDPTAAPVGACAFLADGSYENVTFEYNLCTRTNNEGGYFHYRLLSNNPTSGHIIRGNRFGQRGSVNPVDLFRTTPAVWEDNRYTDGTLISQPAVRN